MNTYKFIQIADIHMGPSIFGDKLYQKAQEQFFEILYQRLDEGDINAVFIPGDVFKQASPHRSYVRSWHRVLRGLYERVEQIVVGIGNHDLPENDVDNNVIAIINDFVDMFHIKNIAVPSYNEVGSYHDTIVGNYTIRLFNYIPMANFDPKIIGKAIQDCDIALLHGSVHAGTLSSGYTLNKPTILLSHEFIKTYAPKQNVLLLGDIHLPQLMEVGSVKVYYCGSPVAVNFGEQHDHGYLLHEINYDDTNFDIKTEFVNVPTLNPVTLKIDQKIETPEDLEIFCKEFNSQYDGTIYKYNICKVVYPPHELIARASNKKNIVDILDKFDYVTFMVDGVQSGEEISNQVEETKYNSDIEYIEDNIKEWAQLTNNDSNILIQRHRELTKEINDA